jgi:hypothetical protein
VLHFQPDAATTPAHGPGFPTGHRYSMHSHSGAPPRVRAGPVCRARAHGLRRFLSVMRLAWLGPADRAAGPSLV